MDRTSELALLPRNSEIFPSLKSDNKKYISKKPKTIAFLLIGTNLVGWVTALNKIHRIALSWQINYPVTLQRHSVDTSIQRTRTFVPVLSSAGMASQAKGSCFETAHP